MLLCTVQRDVEVALQQLLARLHAKLHVVADDDSQVKKVRVWVQCCCCPVIRVCLADHSAAITV